MSLHALLANFVRRQNQFQNQFGHLVAWGSLTLVFVTALVVILRYGFNTGSIALQESIMYNHAILFMLGIAYTYTQDQHVRVDVIYNQLSDINKAWVNLLGTLFFTLPVMAYIIWSGWDYVATSWQIQEASAEAGGIEYLYLLKSLIIIMAVLMIFQGLSILANSYLTLFSPPSEQSDSDVNGGKL